MHWYLDVLKKYAVFDGRARRTELLMFVLFNIIISFGLGAVEGLLGGPGILYMLYSLAVFIPSLAVEIRRLHDTGRSGWWIFIVLVPLVGPLILLIYLLLDSDPGDNKYGPNPKEAV